MNFKTNICLSLLLAGLANSADLAVKNGSFETPVTVESSAVEAWHESREDGLIGGYTIAKSREDMPDTPHGNQWLELIGQPSAPGDVYQRIGGWEVNRFCTVSLLIGNRKVLPDAGLRLELWAGGDDAKVANGKDLDEIGARFLSYVANIAMPANGQTASVTRSLATGADGKLGEPLWLRLVQNGELQSNAVVLIDEVTAKWTDQAVVPAPETLAEEIATLNRSSYAVRSIPVPDGAVIEAGGVCYWPDGTLLVATRRGDVWALRDGSWGLFATGLMEPMGIWADTVGEVYVTQCPELTRIRDVNGDRVADRYETVTSDWVLPGSRTDFVFGLCRDPQGNFYGAMHTTHQHWAGGASPSKTVHNYGGPMGAPAIGRGWSFQVNPQGKLTWWSSGLRAPNGLGFNAEGDLFAVDNQGDWVGTNALHHIKQGDFHGHPSSYFWDPKRTIDLEVPLDQLAADMDKIRKRTAVLFPYVTLGNSPSQPVLAPADGKFGPFAGQMFIGDNVAPLITRVYLEKIGGEYQGVCFPFLREHGLRKALSRMVFSPAGKLVIEYGCRGWGPATQGLQEVSWSGDIPFEMHSINLLSDGFKITFTKPLAEQDLAKAISLKSYGYKYHNTYGSPQVDIEQSEIIGVSISQDRRVVTLKTSPLKAKKVYEFNLSGVKATDGNVLANSDGYYTLNKLQEKPEAADAEKWKFFPLCMDTHDANKRSLEDQAKLFKELGYDGCGHLCQDLGYGNLSYPPDTTLEQRATTLEAQGLSLIQAYGRVYLEKDVPLDLERIKAMMPILAKHKSQLVLLLLGNRQADLDAKAVALLGQLADTAKPHGVPIVIYPHTGDYVQTFAEAVRIVSKVNRLQEVGVMFNLSHWMGCDPNRDLRTVLTESAPWLKAVSINGTNDKSIVTLPLGQGNYDVKQMLDILHDIHFTGPVGLMCWGVGGDARNHLTSSMAAWKQWTAPAQTSSPADSWKIPAAKENFHVFLLMGQSNMSGFGEMLPEDKVPVPHVVKLPTTGEMKWEPAAHPLHNRLSSDRFGLGLPFAQEYLKSHPGVVVGFIPVAWGGAGIDGLKKGTPAYADAMLKAQLADKQGVIKGVLWHQGESDTVSPANADSYEAKLHQLLTDLRKDLGDELLPFIAGNLAEFYGTYKDHNAPERVKQIDQVRSILRSLPEKVPFTGFVESTDCSSIDQNMVHFDRKSYIILGKRYAEIYEKTTKAAMGRAP